MIVLRVPWLPFCETRTRNRVSSSFPSSFRPFCAFRTFLSLSLSLGPPSFDPNKLGDSKVRRLSSPSIFSSCSRLIGGIITPLGRASVQPCFLKIYPLFVLHANTPTPPSRADRSSSSISLEWRAEKLISYETNKNSVLRVDYPSYRTSKQLSFCFSSDSGRCFRILFRLFD